MLSTFRLQSRVATADQAISAAAVIVMALLPIVSQPVQIILGGGSILLTLLSRQLVSFHLSLFLNLFAALILLRVPYSQLIFASMIGLYWAVVALFPTLRAGLNFFKLGSFGREAVYLCFASAALSAAGLLGWFLATSPDLSALIKAFLPNLPLPTLILGGLVFAMVNALVEEVVYRGVVMGVLLESGLPLKIILPLQAVAFGAIHMGGFPSGWLGVGLASLYGFMMGVVRIRSGGLAAPWAGHLLTDLVIVTIVFSAARLQ